MKLTTLTMSAGISFPGLRLSGTLTPGLGTLKDWGVHVRGPSVFLVSIKGWRIGHAPEGDARIVYEIPRNSVQLGWELSEADSLEGLAKWSPSTSLANVGKAAAPGTEFYPAQGSLRSDAPQSQVEQLNMPAGLLASRPLPLQDSVTVSSPDGAPSTPADSVAEGATLSKGKAKR